MGINKLKITRRSEELNEVQEEDLNENSKKLEHPQTNMISTNVSRRQHITTSRSSVGSNRGSIGSNGHDSRYQLETQFNDDNNDIFDELNQNGNQNEVFDLNSNGRSFVDSRRPFNTSANQSFNGGHVRFLKKLTYIKNH